MTEIPPIDKIILVAAHPGCLTPVFGEAALLRLARLAAGRAGEVEVWATPEMAAGWGGLPGQLPDGVAWRGIAAADLPRAVEGDGGEAVQTFLVLPGNSVWDRAAFQAALNSDLPAFRVSGREVLEAVEAWMRQADNPSTPWEAPLPALVCGPGEAREAESRLVAALAAKAKDTDSFMSRRVDRHVSLAISPHLARLQIRPNWVTLAGTAIGCLGAWLLAQTGYWSHLAGALLFLAAVVVDGVDGEVARLALKESTFGHYLDICTDNLVHLVVFVGMAAGLYRASGDIRHLYALGVLFGGFGLCAVAVYRVLDRQGASQEAWHPVAARWVKTLNSRDFAYLIVVLALIDRLAWFLWGAAAGTYVFALTLSFLPYFFRHPADQAE